MNEIIECHGEPTFVLGDDQSRLTVTPRGGHTRMEFRGSEGKWTSPYSLPPWRPEDCPDAPAVLQILRGDFFCFPFGMTEGSKYPHGETSNCQWTVTEVDAHGARFVMELTERPGRITKILRFDPENLTLEQVHQIEGVEGQLNYGHHPTLHVPEGKTGRLSSSRFKFGQVYPHGFVDRSAGEVSALLDGAAFDSLDAVATRDGGSSRLSHYPVREDCEDLVMFSVAEPGLAWTALAISGCIWLGARLVEDFPSTLLWMSNRGRPQPPWNGMHVRRIGIEDICSYFHEGAHRSSKGLLDTQGIPTSRAFRADGTVRLRHFQAVLPIESGGEVGVAAVELRGEGLLVVHLDDGQAREFRTGFATPLPDVNP